MQIVLTTLLILLVAPAGSSNPSPQPRVALPARQIVLTIDDLPAQRAPGLSTEHLERLTGSILSVLENQRIPAVGFVNEDKLYSDGELVQSQVEILKRWLDTGIELGNHSFSHPDLHRTPLEEFETDVLEGEEISRPLAAAMDVPYRYFRHPFLHTGLDLGTKTSLEDFLKQHGYTVAPVTIDNSEWIFARAFDEALTRGVERSFFSGEPTTAQWVQDLAGLEE